MARELITPGYYSAVAIRTTGEDGVHVARWGYAGKTAGTKQVLVYFKITQGEEAGTILPWFGFFTKDSARRSVESLRACGFVGDDLFTLDDQALDQEVQILVEHNEYNDKVYARVAFVNPIGGNTIKMKAPMGDEALRSFSALMKDSISKVPTVKGTTVDANAIPTKMPGGSSGGGARDDAPANGAGASDWDRPGGGFAGSPAAQDDIPF
jgi:hypothetical protein